MQKLRLTVAGFMLFNGIFWPVWYYLIPNTANTEVTVHVIIWMISCMGILSFYILYNVYKENKAINISTDKKEYGMTPQEAIARYMEIYKTDQVPWLVTANYENYIAVGDRDESIRLADNIRGIVLRPTANEYVEEYSYNDKTD